MFPVNPYIFRLQTWVTANETVMCSCSITKKGFQRMGIYSKEKTMLQVYIKFLFITALINSVAIANLVTSSQDNCQEPAPSELRSLLTDDMHESFDMTRYEHFHVTNDINYFKSVTNITLPGPRECRRRRHSTHINTASTCPWHYILNSDPNRSPENIVEADCNCKNRPCIDGMENTRCQPVKYNIRVLRKYGCANGKFLYQRTTERITVGCTCVFRH